MDRLMKLLRALPKLSLVLVLFLGSCVGPVVMYAKSPNWLLAPVDKLDGLSFFVAARPKDAKSAEGFKLIRYEPETDSAKYANLNFHLPEGELSESFRGGGLATSVKADPRGGQLVRLFITGNSPWTSLSEYRVLDNRIQPLRHADSSPWMLLGWLFALVPGEWTELKTEGRQYLILVDESAEVLAREPLGRKEFRAIAERERTREGIVAAISVARP